MPTPAIGYDGVWSPSTPDSTFELTLIPAQHRLANSSGQTVSDDLAVLQPIFFQAPKTLVFSTNQRILGDKPQQACADLREIKEIAAAEGYPEPQDKTISEARLVLDWMWKREPFEYKVDPFDDGAITIQALHDEIYVCVILSPTEPYQCYVTMKGERRISTFTDLDRLCGAFLESALGELRRCAS